MNVQLYSSLNHEWSGYQYVLALLIVVVMCGSSPGFPIKLLLIVSETNKCLLYSTMAGTKNITLSHQVG